MSAYIWESRQDHCEAKEDNSQSSILAFMSTSISGSGSLTLSTSEFLDRFLIPGWICG